MNKVAILGDYSGAELLPTVFCFTVPGNIGREEVIELFDVGLLEAKSHREDGLGMYAADYVCSRTGGTVEFIEVDQELGIE